MYEVNVGDYICADDIPDENTLNQIKAALKARGYNDNNGEHAHWNHKGHYDYLELWDGAGASVLVWSRILSAPRSQRKRIDVEKLLNSFDMMEEQWYISVDGEAEVAAAYRWLNSKGFKFKDEAGAIRRGVFSVTRRFSGNFCEKGELTWNPQTENPVGKEIKLNFKTITVVESVEYPEPTVRDTIEIGGQKYFIFEVESALKSLKPVQG